MEPCNVVIGRPTSEHVAIAIFRYERESTDYDDGNWLVGEIFVAAGVWKGRFGGSLRADEFAVFREQIDKLHQTRAGQAVFASMEESLVLRLVGNGQGLIEVRGEASDHKASGNRLSFRLPALDHTELPALSSQLAELARRFPVVGAP